MAARHNLRPEVVPLVVEVLKESAKCKGVLSEGPGAYCFEGAVCEAYRRSHPDIVGWVQRHGMREFMGKLALTPLEVREWATGGDGFTRIDDELGHALNDNHCWTFPMFIEALTSPEPEEQP